MTRRTVLFCQLPIPPAGPSPIVGNVPLAAGYLILYARLHGLADAFDFQILNPSIANYASDRRVVREILSRDPWMVGFSCYLWNIDRTLWIAAELKRQRPDLTIVLGGPEITADNAWVFESGLVDYAVVGEGEQTFAALLGLLASGSDNSDTSIIPGLWRKSAPAIPLFRKPLPDLNEISSPYLSGILDAADEKLLLLETIRGCIFKCKFCYYPKSYDALYFVAEEKIRANLAHARRAGATEVVLLDPTLNQRKDFDGFLQLLAEENHDRQFTYFGELRAEGIKPETARLLREANFTEVEIGLQSIDPAAQTLMDRKNNLKAFERGVAAMIDAGIKVKVDLIIGLPGDTVASVRRGFDYLASSQLFTSTQVFNLAILPGTAFRQEAADLGLEFQPRPPYYVYETPTLRTEDLYQLMEDAQEVFESEWDPFPEPKLEFDESDPAAPIECVRLELDSDPVTLPPPEDRAQAMTLWFRADDFSRHQKQMEQTVERLLDDCPHSTLQIVLEPTGNRESIRPEALESLLAISYRRPNYLDRYYSLAPQGLLGSKRIVIKLPDEIDAEELSDEDPWTESVLDSATIC
ncbi:MAG: radical SAM protein [Pirellulales bacterium]